MFLTLIIVSCFFYLPGRLCTRLSISLLFAFTRMLLHKTYREKKKEKKKVLAFQAVHANLGIFHKFEIVFNCSPLSHGFHAWSSCTVREKECCFSRKCWSHLSEMFSIFRIPLSQATASAMSMICPRVFPHPICPTTITELCFFCLI